MNAAARLSPGRGECHLLQRPQQSDLASLAQHAEVQHEPHPPLPHLQSLQEQEVQQQDADVVTDVLLAHGARRTMPAVHTATNRVFIIRILSCAAGAERHGRRVCSRANGGATRPRPTLPAQLRDRTKRLDCPAAELFAGASAAVDPRGWRLDPQDDLQILAQAGEFDRDARSRRTGRLVRDFALRLRGNAGRIRRDGAFAGPPATLKARSRKFGLLCLLELRLPV